MSELADGWTWARISDITEQVPNLKPDDYPEKEFGYVDISSICNSTYRIAQVKRFTGGDAPSRARRPIRPNDILFSNVRTYLRNIAIVPPDTEAEICSTGFTVLRPTTAIEARFLFRYVLTNNFIDRVTPQQTGTHYPATSDRVVRSEPIPLPPINEQRRILAKLEELLDNVEACQKRLAKIPVILKRFRQSVLTAACSGPLTEDWRSENRDDSERVVGLREGGKEGSGDLSDSWEWGTVESVCERVVDCPHSTPVWTTSGFLCVRTSNFRPGLLKLAEVSYVSPKTYHERTGRLRPKAGDILYSREGAILGVACPVPAGIDLCLGQRMMLLRTKKAYSSNSHVAKAATMNLRQRFLTEFEKNPESRRSARQRLRGEVRSQKEGDLKKRSGNTTCVSHL